jgi:rhodanese-related sulfurtransferase
MERHEMLQTPDYTQIVGVFSEDTLAKQAIEALKQAGFGEETISLTEYRPSAEAEAANLAQQTDEVFQQMRTLSHLAPVSARRLLVHVQAAGRQQEAVDILVQHGADNSHIPPGAELVHGAIVRSHR